jgi:hypothetical protein
MAVFFYFSITSLTSVTTEEKRELSLANSLPSTSDRSALQVEQEVASRKLVNNLQEGPAQTYNPKFD